MRRGRLEFAAWAAVGLIGLGAAIWPALVWVTGGR